MKKTTSLLRDDGARVVFSKQTHYQKIVLMEEKSEDKELFGNKQFVLYLDGFLQFSTIDEQTYHACIANVPMAAASFSGEAPKKALILGGGDGLAARNLLVSPQLESVTLIELDPAMTTLAKTHPILTQHNLKSLESPRMRVINADAFQWVNQTDEQFDFAVIDFPLPKNLTLARLFSAEFYSSLLKRMSPKGVFAIQAGPSFSYEDTTFMTLSKVTSSIAATLRAIGVKPYVYISVLDNEAFVLVSKDPNFDMTAFAKKVGILGETGFGRICSYSTEWKAAPVKINTLNTLTVADYMLEWMRYGRKTFFHYHGAKANFLPD